MRRRRGSGRPIARTKGHLCLECQTSPAVVDGLCQTHAAAAQREQALFEIDAAGRPSIEPARTRAQVIAELKTATPAAAGEEPKKDQENAMSDSPFYPWSSADEFTEVEEAYRRRAAEAEETWQRRAAIEATEHPIAVTLGIDCSVTPGEFIVACPYCRRAHRHPQPLANPSPAPCGRGTYLVGMATVWGSTSTTSSQPDDLVEAAVREAIEFIHDNGAVAVVDVIGALQRFIPIAGDEVVVSGGRPIGDGAVMAPAPPDTVLFRGVSPEFVRLVEGVLAGPNVVLEATECGCSDGCFGAVALAWTGRD